MQSLSSLTYYPQMPALPRLHKALLLALCALFLLPPELGAALQTPRSEAYPDLPEGEEVVADAQVAVPVVPKDEAAPEDSMVNIVVAPGYTLEGKKEFNPSPERAVWLAALCPGLGQIYNRRYWKLPIIVGGFMGLGYATNWNNTQLQDYSQAYHDLLDNDPNTNSYMDFFPPTTSEDSLDKSWLQQVMRNRKNYYRRNRDLCIICMVGLYLLCVVDAYVDASLAHFDISPDISMEWEPAIFVGPGTRRPAYGLQWALNF